MTSLKRVEAAPEINRVSPERVVLLRAVLAQIRARIRDGYEDARARRLKFGASMIRMPVGFYALVAEESKFFNDFSRARMRVRARGRPFGVCGGRHRKIP